MTFNPIIQPLQQPPNNLWLIILVRGKFISVFLCHCHRHPIDLVSTQPSNNKSSLCMWPNRWLGGVRHGAPSLDLYGGVVNLTLWWEMSGFRVGEQTHKTQGRPGIPNSQLVGPPKRVQQARNLNFNADCRRDALCIESFSLMCLDDILGSLYM